MAILLLKLGFSFTYGTHSPTKTHLPKNLYVLNWKSRDVQLPSYFESFYFPHICAFVAAAGHVLKRVANPLYLKTDLAITLESFTLI